MENRQPGKIYILRNSALKDTIIKIGRTNRISENRAKEISKGTGVPVDYEVLYEEDVLDCVLAERNIHKFLVAERVNPGREFFRLPLKNAVRVVFKTCLKVNNSIKKKAGKRIAIFLDIAKVSALSLKKLKQVLLNHKGKATLVFLCLKTKSHKSIQILVGKDLYVNFSPGLINDCKTIKGIKVEWLSQKMNEYGAYTEESEVIDWNN